METETGRGSQAERGGASEERERGEKEKTNGKTKGNKELVCKGFVRADSFVY